MTIAPHAYGDIIVNSLPGSSIVGVRFDTTVSLPSAIDPSNYLVFGKSSGQMTVTNVELQSDQQSVALYLSAPISEFFAVGVTNVLDSLSNPINAIATGYTSEYLNASIGTNSDPNPAGKVFTALPDAFDVTASGSGIGDTGDHCHFVFQQVTGNFEVAALVTRLDAADPQSMAGLMVRENQATGSRSLGAYFTADSSNQEIQMIARTTNNGLAQPFATAVSNASLVWLRLTRTNNIFTAYYGTNGSDWITSGITSNAFNNSLSVGMAVSSHHNGLTTTASFENFGVAAARPGDTTLPTLHARVYQQTNLVVSWQRTPRDFTVQITPSLIFTNNSDGSGSDTNATQWGFLMNPVFDTSLTGTNDAMPTPGRYMIVPINMFSNDQMFVRLARVFRVIPDPPTVTAGTVYAAGGNGLTITLGTATLCGTTVDTATALAQATVPVYCAAGKTYQFTTGGSQGSGTALKTVIQLKSYPSGPTYCDALFTAGTNKSQVTVLQTNTSPLAGYTFIAAVTSDSPKPNGTCVLKVRVNY